MASVIDDVMSTKHWWSERERDEQEYSEKNLSFCLFIHQNSLMDCPGIEHDPTS
jgi:hypothetical protein